MSSKTQPTTQYANYVLKESDGVITHTNKGTAEHYLPSEPKISPHPQASEERALENEPHLSEPAISWWDKKGVTDSKTKRIRELASTFPKWSYHKFMTIDQAGPAAIGYDDAERTLVAIKRLKKTKVPLPRLPKFACDQLFGIRDMYVDGNDVIFVYEQMNVSLSLRHITGILQGPLKAFQIVAICREVSILLDCSTPDILTIAD
jgi:hypothetical protein